MFGLVSDNFGLCLCRQRREEMKHVRTELNPPNGKAAHPQFVVPFGKIDLAVGNQLVSI